MVEAIPSQRPLSLMEEWSEFTWPDWVPEPVRAEIERFWSPSIHRRPREWEADRVHRGFPELGAVVTALSFGRMGENPLAERVRRAQGHEPVTGRYVHCWNNIGRVVTDDGEIHAVSLPETHPGSEVFTQEEWIEEGLRRFGEDRLAWTFRCASCGNLQSARSVAQRNPEIPADQARTWVHQECEGRHTPGVGCDWTLGGLFNIRCAAVLHNGVRHPVFEFAPAVQAARVQYDREHGLWLCPECSFSHASALEMGQHLRHAHQLVLATAASEVPV